MKPAIILAAGMILVMVGGVMSGRAMAAAGQPLKSLHIAAGDGDIEQLKLHIAKGANLNAIDDYRYTPITRAIETGQLDAAKLLLEAGADANGKDGNERFPLILVTATNRTEFVALLLANGARTNVKDRSGQLPLHIAAQRGSAEIVDLLLKAGADANAEVSGRTPLMIALGRNQTEIAALLRKHGATEPPASEYGDLYGAGYGQMAAPAPESFTARAQPAEIDINPEQILKQVQAIEGLAAALAAIDANSQNEQRSWSQRRIDNRTSLLRSVEQQFGAEMAFVKGVAVAEKAEKTIGGIDELTAVRTRRYEAISNAIREQRRQQMLEERESRLGGRGRYSGRGGRGQYSRGTGVQSSVDPYGGSTRTRTSRRAEPNEPPLDADSQAQVNSWLNGDPQNKDSLLKDTHELDIAELSALHFLATEEKAARTQVALLGLLMLHERRIANVTEKWNAEDERLQRLQQRMGTTGTQQNNQMMGGRSRQGRY